MKERMKLVGSLDEADEDSLGENETCWFVG